MSIIRIFGESSNLWNHLTIEFERRRRFLLLGSGVNRERLTDSYVAPRVEREVVPPMPPLAIPAELYERSLGGSGRWAVVLLNDEHHSMDYVIWALLKTFPELSSTEATLIMMEAHNTGKGVVTLCDRDQAVQYRDSLRILQLGCEIESGW